MIKLLKLWIFGLKELLIFYLLFFIIFLPLVIVFAIAITIVYFICPSIEKALDIAKIIYIILTILYIPIGFAIIIKLRYSGIKNPLRVVFKKR